MLRPLDSPSQDFRPFGLQLVGQALVASLRRYGDGKGQQRHAGADCLIYPAKAGLIVARDDESQLRVEVEKVAAHEAGCHAIPAGQILDNGFIPCLANRQFAARHQPRALEPGQPGCVFLAMGIEEGFSRRAPGVVAPDMCQGIEESRFPVAPRAVEKQQLVLGGQPGQGIARRALHEGHQIGVTVEDFIQEGEPPFRV